MADNAGAHLWLVLMKAHRTLVRHAQLSIRAHEMALSDFIILEALLHKGPLLISELGRIAQLTSGAITTAIDRLEAQHLVARSAHASDRRARVVTLTPEGRALIGPIFRQHSAHLDAASSGLTAGERRTLVGLLKKLGKTAEQKLEPAAPGGGAAAAGH